MREALGISGDPVGEITHHDLMSDGSITYYNVKIDDEIYTHIPLETYVDNYLRDSDIL